MSTFPTLLGAKATMLGGLTRVDLCVAGGGYMVLSMFTTSGIFFHSRHCGDALRSALHPATPAAGFFRPPWRSRPGPLVEQHEGGQTMKTSVFPVAEVSKNRIVDIDGNISYAFELSPPDLEQLTPVEKDNFFEGVSDFLDEMPENDCLKFYRINGRGLITTNNSSPAIPSVKLRPSEDPLGTFLGADFLYSDIAVNDDCLSYNGRYLRILSAESFGENPIDEGFLPGWTDYVLFVRKIPKADALSKLERIRTGHLFSLTKTKRDISGEESYNQAEELIEDLTRGRENLFAIELFFIIRADSPRELNRLTDDFHADLAGRKLTTFIEGQSLRRFKTGLLAFLLRTDPRSVARVEVARASGQDLPLALFAPPRLFPAHGSRLLLLGLHGTGTFFQSLRSRS